jgi:hypothetical protein
MRRTSIAVLLLALVAGPLLAQDARVGGAPARGARPAPGPGHRPPPGPGYGNGLDIWVPIDPYEHERTWYMHRSDRSLVPPAVSIDGEPYVCDLDGKRFSDREKFVGHLRGDHGIPRDEIRRGIYEVDGLVHFAAE